MVVIGLPCESCIGYPLPSHNCISMPERRVSSGRQNAVADGRDIRHGIAFVHLDGRPVLEYIAGYLRRQKLAKVVVGFRLRPGRAGRRRCGPRRRALPPAEPTKSAPSKISGRLDFFHAISARLEAGEEVFAVLIGLRDGDMGFRLIDQINRHAGQEAARPGRNRRCCWRRQRLFRLCWRAEFRRSRSLLPLTPPASVMASIKSGFSAVPPTEPTLAAPSRYPAGWVSDTA